MSTFIVDNILKDSESKFCNRNNESESYFYTMYKRVVVTGTINYTGHYY